MRVQAVEEDRYSPLPQATSSEYIRSIAPSAPATIARDIRSLRSRCHGRASVGYEVHDDCALRDNLGFLVKSPITTRVFGLLEQDRVRHQLGMKRYGVDLGAANLLSSIGMFCCICST
jgi:hypothetical protein